MNVLKLEYAKDVDAVHGQKALVSSVFIPSKFTHILREWKTSWQVLENLILLFMNLP